MKFVDVKDLKNKTQAVLSFLEQENVVITKKGQPIALIKKFNESIEKKLSKEIVKKLVKSDENIAAQYSAMMEVWGDPKCDIYDKVFMDD